MNKKCLRWYEKNEYLSAFLSLLADLPADEQCEIAVDIILSATQLLDRDYEKVVAQVGDFDRKDYRRWYDKNPSIHTAIESLRDLDDEQRENIIKEFSGKILSSHYASDLSELDEQQ